MTSNVRSALWTLTLPVTVLIETGRQIVISKGVDETLLSFSSYLSGYYGNTGCEELFMGGIQNYVSRKSSI